MLSHYRLVEKIGEGGMGVVWRATDTTLDRDVALKILPDLFSADPERLARFEREAKLLASLNHANIATIHGIGESEGLRFVVMEMVEGEDLAQRLSRGPLPVEETLAAAVQLAEALEVAHEQGIIHRDLKPANIKLTPEGKVKVLDFGLAKAFEPERSGESSASMSPTVTSAGTVAGVLLGTAAYMSPEQAKAKSGVDRRADIWAFGVVLCEMLIGRKLFPGESISETLAAVIMGEPDLGSLPANTPPRVRRLIERSLRKDPQSRLRDVGDARVVLEESLAGHEWTTAGTAAAPARPSLPWVAALVLAGIVVGVVAGFVLRPSSTPPAVRTARTSIMPAATTDPWPLITRDGELMGYSADDRIVVRRLDSYEERTIPGTENHGFAWFSPDGRWIAFTRDSKVYKVPVDGSAPPVELGSMSPSWLVWMPGGQLVSITNEPWRIDKLMADGSDPGPAVDIHGDELGQNFFFVTSPLPDDRHVLASADTYREDGGWQMNVVLLDTETGEARLLVENGVFASWSPTGHLLFTRQGTLLAVPFDLDRFEVLGGPVALLDGLWVPTPALSAVFGVTDEGTLIYRTDSGEFEEQLVIVDRDGTIVPWSEERRDFGRELAVSPDGRLIAAHVMNWNEGLDEIWFSEMDRPRLRPIADEPSLDCYRPVWAPDSQVLYFVCNGRGDLGGIHRRRADGGEMELILARPSADASYHPLSISPDGASLLITRISEEPAILLLPTKRDGDGTNTPEELIVGDDVNYFWGARFSPDGRLIVYHSFETGRGEVYVRTIDARGTLGPKRLVSRDGGGAPVWSMTDPGEPLELIYVQGSRALVVSIDTGSLEISEPKVLFEDYEQMGLTIARPMPDGRLVAARREIEPEREMGRIHVVFNWFDELERLAPH
jgi:serine/threonine-protein kinase